MNATTEKDKGTDFERLMKKYGEMGLYPIFKSGSKRGISFLRLANRKYLILGVVCLMNLFKSS